MKPNNGGAAFPNVPDGAGDKWSEWDTGMTLRQYYAAKAMQAYVPRPDYGIQQIVQYAFETADAMIKFEEQEK